mgnify:FL=1
MSDRCRGNTAWEKATETASIILKMPTIVDIIFKDTHLINEC